MSNNKTRTLVIDCLQDIGKEVSVSGWVHTVRSHGKIAFFDLRDRSGILQIGAFKPDLAKAVSELGPQYVVSATGVIKKREERYINKNSHVGTIELELHSLEVIEKSAEMPFDMGGIDLNLDLPALLDNRALTLRHPKIQAIFKVQEVIIDSFREFMKSQGFFEFQAPSIAPAVAEGGSEVFEVNYFEHKAYLSQSPQLYKQIVMTAFERVFSVNKVFRAEPSVTTRHLTEVVSMDAEMAFIESWEDVRDMADKTIKFIFQQLEKKCMRELVMFDATLPSVIEKTPSISLQKAQEKIFKNSGRDVRSEKDLNPEDEREICTIIKKETGSDLVFIYGYPTKKKPFYVYPDPDNPEYNHGMDLLCRGVEWLSGGRRINSYQQLLKHVSEWKMDPNKIKMFLDAFKYGSPPEGGFAFGAERITMQILGLSNIREASMFPRDMERIDERLTKEKKGKTQSQSK